MRLIVVSMVLVVVASAWAWCWELPSEYDSGWQGDIYISGKFNQERNPPTTTTIGNTISPVTSHSLKVEEPVTVLTVSDDYKTVEYDPAKVTVRPFGTDVGYYLAGELRLEAYCKETVPFFRVICPDGTEIVTRAVGLYSNDGTYQGDVLVLMSEKEKP